jgi:hypothetical protein
MLRQIPTLSGCQFRQAGTGWVGGSGAGPSSVDGNHAMSPLATALICFGAFVLIGLVAKPAIGIWIKRSGIPPRAREPD